MTKRAADESVTVPRAAVLLGLEPHTVYALIDRGEPVADIAMAPGPRPRRQLRVARASKDDYVSRARVRPGSLRHLYRL